MANQNGLGLKNIGPEIEELLASIGITTKAEFEKIGAKKIYSQLMEVGQQANEKLRLALIGAEKDLDWEIVASKEDRKIKSRFTDQDEV